MLNFKMLRDTKGCVEAIETSATGKRLLSTAKLNKGNAFTKEERREFALLGKLPYSEETLEQQVQRIYQQYCEIPTDLAKNLFLTELHDRNETLFYRLVSDHLKEMLPIVYTPTVGEAVKAFSLEMREPRGLFIAYPDRDQIPEILDNRLNPDVDLIVVTDGERVLGIGDQGIGGMNISIAKLMVYTLCAGFNPHRVLPIQLDVGTNNQALLDDPMYLGWRHARIHGQDYDDFIEAFVTAVRSKMPKVYLHWEDFGRDNARKNLERYRDTLLSFNDDMQGTGVVTLACVLAAVQAAGAPLTQQRIVFFGAGTAGVGIADQICDAMVREGLSLSEARDKIWLIDRQGLLLENSDLLDFQRPYAKKRDLIAHWEVHSPAPGLLEVVKGLKPTVLVGCSAVRDAFSEEVIKTMAQGVERPIILPLSNPTEKAEAEPESLLKWTDGKAIVATGSPFPDVSFNGRSIRISQSNNAFVFPGIGLGSIAVKAKKVTDNMLYVAAKTLADLSPAKEDPTEPILPDLTEVQLISRKVALAVIQQAVDDGVAVMPDNIELAINQVSWQPRYYPYLKVSE